MITRNRNTHGRPPSHRQAMALRAGAQLSDKNAAAGEWSARVATVSPVEIRSSLVIAAYVCAAGGVVTGTGPDSETLSGFLEEVESPYREVGCDDGDPDWGDPADTDADNASSEQDEAHGRSDGASGDSGDH